MKYTTPYIPLDFHKDLQDIREQLPGLSVDCPKQKSHSLFCKHF